MKKFTQKHFSNPTNNVMESLHARLLGLTGRSQSSVWMFRSVCKKCLRHHYKMLTGGKDAKQLVDCKRLKWLVKDLQVHKSSVKLVDGSGSMRQFLIECTKIVGKKAREEQDLVILDNDVEDEQSE